MIGIHRFKVRWIHELVTLSWQYDIKKMSQLWICDPDCPAFNTNEYCAPQRTVFICDASIQIIKYSLISAECLYWHFFSSRYTMLEDCIIIYYTFTIGR